MLDVVSSPSFKAARQQRKVLLCTRSMTFILFVFLGACLGISLYHLRNANKQIVSLVRVLYEQGSVKEQTVKRSVVTHHDEMKQLQQHNQQLTREVQLLTQMMSNSSQSCEDALRQVGVLKVKADELNVERARLSGELNVALKQVQALEDAQALFTKQLQDVNTHTPQQQAAEQPVVAASASSIAAAQVQPAEAIPATSQDPTQDSIMDISIERTG